MYEMRGDKYYFILIDYDMGVVLPTGNNPSYKVSSKHRTGTLPFMSCALIEDAWLALRPGGDWTHIRHLLCHDYESLFWVSLWCPLMLPMPGLTAPQVQALQDEARSWELGDLKIIHSVKNTLITGGLAKLPLLPPAVACLELWFVAWMRLIKTSRRIVDDRYDAAHERKLRGLAMDLEPWDAETLGGTLTRDTIKTALTPEMPFRQPDDGSDEEPADTPEPASGEEKTSKRKTRGKSQRVQQVFSDMRARLRPRK